MREGVLWANYLNLSDNVSEIIEPNRNYDIIDEMRKLAYENIDLAMLKILNYNINKQLNAGKMLHSETINARNYLIAKGVNVWVKKW